MSRTQKEIQLCHSPYKTKAFTAFASEEVKFNLLICVYWIVRWQVNEVGLIYPNNCFYQMSSHHILVG